MKRKHMGTLLSICWSRQRQILFDIYSRNNSSDWFIAEQFGFSGRISNQCWALIIYSSHKCGCGKNKRLKSFSNLFLLSSSVFILFTLFAVLINKYWMEITPEMMSREELNPLYVPMAISLGFAALTLTTWGNSISDFYLYCLV